MPKQDLTKWARDYISAFNKGDWSAMTARMTPSTIYNEIGTQRVLKGPDAIIDAMKGWRKSMSDATGTVNHAVESGDTVVLEITWTGTQNGPLETPGGTVPPSGKRQTTPAAMFIKFKGDKITESRHYFDMLSFLKQIGATHALTA